MNLLETPADELALIAREASVRLDGAPAEAVLEWAFGRFGERFCITSSFADWVARADEQELT